MELETGYSSHILYPEAHTRELGLILFFFFFFFEMAGDFYFSFFFFKFYFIFKLYIIVLVLPNIGMFKMSSSWVRLASLYTIHSPFLAKVSIQVST